MYRNILQGFLDPVDSVYRSALTSGAQIQGVG